MTFLMEIYLDSFLRLFYPLCWSTYKGLGAERPKNYALEQCFWGFLFVFVFDEVPIKHILSFTSRYKWTTYTHTLLLCPGLLLFSMNSLAQGHIIQSHGWKYTCCPLPNSYHHSFSMLLLILKLSDIATCMFVTHPDSSSATEPTVSIHPQIAAPPSFLFNKFHNYLLSCLNWIRRDHPCVLLKPLSPTIWSITVSCWFISNIHLESTHDPPIALSLKAQGLPWIFLAASSLGLNSNVTLCISDLLSLNAVS